MYFLLGNSHMESGEYERAIESFEHAQAQTRHHRSQSLLVVSLVSSLTALLQYIKMVTFFIIRYPVGNLMISISPFDRAFVKPYMQQVARRRPASLFSKW